MENLSFSRIAFILYVELLLFFFLLGATLVGNISLKISSLIIIAFLILLIYLLLVLCKKAKNRMFLAFLLIIYLIIVIAVHVFSAFYFFIGTTNCPICP